MNFIDSHAHLTMPALLKNVDEIVKRATKNNVKKIINICVDKKGLEEGLKLYEKYDFIFNAAACSPHDVEKEGDSFFIQVEDAIKNKKLIAIGETGLDYYYEHSKKEVQKKHFEEYLILAQRYKLPLIFHVREAFEDLFKITDEVFPKCKAILHCFTGSPEEAVQALDRGWLISFSGIITFKKSDLLREVVKMVPLDKILIETDSPYLAPQSRRGVMF